MEIKSQLAEDFWCHDRCCSWREGLPDGSSFSEKAWMESGPFFLMEASESSSSRKISPFRMFSSVVQLRQVKVFVKLWRGLVSFLLMRNRNFGPGEKVCKLTIP